MKPRYSFGGDEHVFVEFGEEMSLEGFFASMSLTNAIRDSRIRGVTEICPANATLLVKYDPDVISPADMMGEIRQLETAAEKTEPVLRTRIIEMPVYYNDPWTHETLMRFRDRHQAPDATDLEYSAKISGYDDVSSFIGAHAGSPWFVSAVGFVAGLPFMYQMVERPLQIDVPKYLRPRLDTPRLTVGHGGCFGCVYSVRGAGGYQMFGVTPMPIYDPRQELNYLRDFMIFFKPGDIVKFKPVGREEYDDTVRRVDANNFEPLIRQVTFNLEDFHKAPTACNQALEGILHDR
ncbi:5-oxoprolinase subunit B family protein [Telmatospirillum siberiense]|uniref:Allophanate hydrolase n=1 Tax=Telmatospirillum siberiense TaxID=382514 RepID=A0A2N3PR31_9PROT|nr:carboxyltransferase domain-containing protein [Telmatospirillum siberiense]PKU22858.1 allophanate hydrolase [Telmatospirillum siberiense]